MSIYQNKEYKYKGFSLREFLQLVKNYPKEFISYCEIVIDRKGLIHLAIPSHYETIIRLLGYKDSNDMHEKLSREELLCINVTKETGSIIVYYRLQNYYKINLKQRHVLNVLDYHNIIEKNLVRLQ